MDSEEILFYVNLEWSLRRMADELDRHMMAKVVGDIPRETTRHILERTKVLLQTVEDALTSTET